MSIPELMIQLNKLDLEIDRLIDEPIRDQTKLEELVRQRRVVDEQLNEEMSATVKKMLSRPNIKRIK